MSLIMTDSIVLYVMSEIFTTINHRLSEEYTKIELQLQK